MTMKKKKKTRIKPKFTKFRPCTEKTKTRKYLICELQLRIASEANKLFCTAGVKAVRNCHSLQCILCGLVPSAGEKRNHALFTGGKTVGEFNGPRATFISHCINTQYFRLSLCSLLCGLLLLLRPFSLRLS